MASTRPLTSDGISGGDALRPLPPTVFMPEEDACGGEPTCPREPAWLDGLHAAGPLPLSAVGDEEDADDADDLDDEDDEDLDDDEDEDSVGDDEDEDEDDGEDDEDDEDDDEEAEDEGGTSALPGTRH